jgi:hypothetical protein
MLTDRALCLLPALDHEPQPGLEVRLEPSVLLL